jgi:hypothetical protein
MLAKKIKANVHDQAQEIISEAEAAAEKADALIADSIKSLVSELKNAISQDDHYHIELKIDELKDIITKSSSGI